MTEQFFSLDYTGRGDLFEGLAIWEDENYKKLQGTWPVISLSFANVKKKDYESTKYRIGQLLINLYVKHAYLKDSDVLTDADRLFLKE